jgi:hypothetical protein
MLWWDDGFRSNGSENSSSANSTESGEDGKHNSRVRKGWSVSQQSQKRMVCTTTEFGGDGRYVSQQSQERMIGTTTASREDGKYVQQQDQERFLFLFSRELGEDRWDTILKATVQPD